MPGVPQPGHRRLGAAAPDQVDVEEAAGAGPYTLAVVRVDAAVREHHRARARGVGRTQDRTGVAGVGHAGQHHDQPGQVVQHRRDVGVVRLPADGDHALRGHGLGEGGEARLGDRPHGQIRRVGRLDQFPGPAEPLHRPEQLLDGAAGERLTDGLRALGQEPSRVVAMTAAQQPAGRDDPGRPLGKQGPPRVGKAAYPSRSSGSGGRLSPAAGRDARQRRPSRRHQAGEGRSRR